MEHHPADELHVEVAHVERALRRLADDGERLREQVVERLAPREAILELRGSCRERLVRERRDLRLERVDPCDGLGVRLDQAVVAAAEDRPEEPGNHCGEMGANEKKASLSCD